MARLDHLKLTLNELTDKEREQIEDYLMGIDEARNVLASRESEVVPASDLIEEAIEHHKMWGKRVGLSTGFRMVDQMTKGLAPGEMTVIGGQTSHGKTALSINIAANLIKQDIPVLFITLEMTHKELLSRFVHIMGEDAYTEHAASLYLQKRDELDWRSIDRLVAKAKEECDIQMVFIDHLHYLVNQTDNQFAEIGLIVKAVKKNAIRHDVPIVLISHVRKKSGKKGVQDNDELAGSARIAQDADIVMFVSRNKDVKDKIIVECTKNRNRGGDLFDPKLFNFHETIITEPHVPFMHTNVGSEVEGEQPNPPKQEPTPLF